MAELLGTISSIVSIIQLSSEIVKYISGVSGATKERKRLREEFRACEFILQQLKDDADDVEEGKMWLETIEALQGPDAPLGRLWVTFSVVKAKLEPKKGVQKAWVSLKWPFDEKGVDRIISTIEREKALLGLALTNDCRKLIHAIKKSSNESKQQIIELKDVLARIQESQTGLQNGVDRFNQDQNYLQRRAILDWLTPVDYAIQQHDFISQRQAGTSQWLLGSAEFQGWLQTGKQTLFCPGIPGAGKTIITATVIDDLITRFQNDPSIGVVYLYCDFRRQEEQNAEDLITNLLKQLSQEQSILPDSLKRLYDQYKDKRTQLSFDEILETLHEIAATYSRIFIIIDALDECQAFDGCRMKLLSEISNFQAKCNANLFATSRNIPEIIERFKLSISLEIRARDEDVRMYLDNRLSKSESDVLKAYREEITIAITKSVDGMFLLAHLHFESVRTKRTLKKIKDALKSLPTGLKAYDRAYDEAMERIAGQDPDSKELAEIVLSWITCANRRLTTSELQCALAVEVGDRELEEENLPQIRDMVSVCAGLVAIDEESNVIRLVHYTTQEYFERTQGRWFPNAEIGIAKTCITYLLFDVFESGFCLTDEDFEKRLLLNPLYDYAAQNWGHHARVALDEEVKKLILVFLQSMPKVSASSQAGMASKDSVGYSQKVPQQITGLHLAAYFGLSDVTLTLIMHGHSPNVTNSYHQTPLLLAAAKGHKAAVSALIAVDGIDINCEDEHGRTPLSFAAEGGHERVVNQLLAEDNVDLNSKDEYGQTPLSWAAWKGHTAVVDLLSTNGCSSPNLDHTLYGATYLSSAARKGNEEAVKLFLTHIHPNSIDENGQTPVAVAAACGKEAILKLMIAIDRVYLDFKDVHGRTALMYAAENGHEAIVKLLLDVKKVDHSAKDKDGQTALFWALENKHESIVKLLLERLLDANPKINGGQTLLFSTEETKIVELLFKEGYQDSSKAQSGRTLLSYAAECGYDRVVNLLYSNGYRVNSKRKNSPTALSYAAGKGHEAVIKFLLENGAMLELNDDKGWTPIFFAAQNGHEAVVKFLLENGAMLELKDNKGWTPLFFAAQNGHEAVVKFLLENGAMLELKDNKGWTPLFFAAQNGHEAVVKFLLENGAMLELKDNKGWTPLFFAAQNGHEAVVKFLLENGAMLELKDNKGWTPLFFAAQNGHEAVVKLLLENGAMLELKDNKGWTPLFFAAQNGHEAVVKLLLESDAMLELKDNKGWTPLFFAAQNGHEAVINFLLKSGAELELMDSEGWTPLMFAAVSGQEAVVKLLLTRDDIDVDAKDIGGRTALWHAVHQRHGKAAQQLCNKGADMKALLGIKHEIITPTLTRFWRSNYVYIRSAKDAMLG